MKARVYNSIFLAVLIIAFFLRIVFISSDPINNDFLSTRDEGLYSYAARSMVLFGKWQTDNFSYARIMPVFPPLQLIGVKLLGIHSYAFRFVSVFFSLLTIIALFLFIKKNINVFSAIIACILLSVNFMYLVFSRSGLPEITMIFFSFLSFIFWFNALSDKKKTHINAFLSGLFFIIAFLTKQSMISLIGIYFITSIYLFFKDRVRLKKIIVGFSIPVVVLLLAYYWLFYRSNPKEWYDNYLATINIHRLRREFFFFFYLANQFRDFIISDYWKYCGILILSCMVIVMLEGAKRLIASSKILSLLPTSSGSLQNDKGYILHKSIIILSSLWFLFIMGHMFIAPGKFGRFFVISVIPLIILFSYLFNLAKGKIKYLFFFLFFLDIMLNSFNIYKYIFFNPKYSYQIAVQELNKFITKDDLSSLPPHWIMNADFKTVNPFLVSPSDIEISRFFDKYGWPKYVSIIDYQTEMYRVKTPVYFNHFSPVKKINDYIIYKVK